MKAILLSVFFAFGLRVLAHPVPENPEWLTYPVVFFTRLLTLPNSELAHIVKYVDSGRPFIALRTANHGFSGPYVFAGSVLNGDGPGPRRHLSDESGNVLSLSTFGDELLCLPTIHSQDAEALLWQVNPTNLPAVGSNVTLRLRPQLLPAGKAAQTSQCPAGKGHP